MSIMSLLLRKRQRMHDRKRVGGQQRSLSFLLSETSASREFHPPPNPTLFIVHFGEQIRIKLLSVRKGFFGGQGEENSIILQNDGQLGEKGEIFHITKVKEWRPSKG